MLKFDRVKKAAFLSCLAMLFSSGSYPAVAAPFVVDNSILTDYVIPDVCADAAGHAVPGDPYACPAGSAKRNLRVGEEIPYTLGRTPNGNAKNSSTVYISFPATDDQGNVLLVNLLDNKGTTTVGNKKLSTGLFDLDLLNDTYGVIAWSGNSETYSSVETRGSKGPNGWMTVGCQSMDSWVVLPKDFVPFAEPDRIHTLSPLRLANIAYTDRIKDKSDYGTWMYRLPPLERRADGLYRGNSRLCDSTGKETNFTKSKALKRYGSIHGYTFESGKVMDTVWVEHFYQDPKLAFAKHNSRLGMEKVFYTREYGNSRWETWQSNTTLAAKCADEDDAGACTNQRMEDALSGDRNGCPKGGDAKMTVDGVTMYRVACSDRTTVAAIPNALRSLPVEPRVYHVSRQLFGANQNWVLNPDFAGGTMEGWQADNGVSDIKTSPEKLTQNSRLELSCNGDCSVAASRKILTKDIAYGTEEVMTQAERDKLTWLKMIDAGISLQSAASSDVGARLTVRFVDQNKKVVAERSQDEILTSGQAKRVKLSMPFTLADLSVSSTLELSVAFSNAKGTIFVDEAYILPIP